MTLINTPLGKVQMCKNPWKRGGFYFRGRLAPWVDNPDALSDKQLERVRALTNTMVDKCTGVRGSEEGVTKAALCLKKNIPGKLSAEEKKRRKEERLRAKRKGATSEFYTGGKIE